MTDEAVDPSKVRYLSLVRKEGGEPILGIPYQEMSVDPDLVASFVLAVVIYENRQLKTFTKEGYVVIIEEGKHVLGLLIVDKVEDEDLYRRNLQKVIGVFEEEHKANLENWRGDIRPFRQFALTILSVFPYEGVDVSLVPKLIRRPHQGSGERTNIPWSVGSADQKLQAIVGFINGKRTVAEILDASGFKREESLAVFSMLKKFKWIRLSRQLTDDSVLVKTADAPEVLLGVYGEQLSRILEECNGRRTLREICQRLAYSVEVVRTVAQTLIDSGVLVYLDEMRGAES